MYVQERAVEVCAVKPAKDAGLDARDWEPVGEDSFKEVCIRSGPTGGQEAYVLVVDGGGTAKACTQKAYALPIAVQIARGIPLPVFAGRNGTLVTEIMAESMRKAQEVRQSGEA
jgi:hypothetical protein